MKKNKKIFDYDFVYKISRKSIYRYSGNDSLAKYLAHAVAGEFVLKKISGHKKEMVGWIFTTSKYKVLENHSLHKRTEKIADKAADKKYYDDLMKEAQTDTVLHNSYQKAKKMLSQENMITLMLLQDFDYDYGVVSGILELSENAVRKRKSRIFKELKANTNISMGVSGTKLIETPAIYTKLYDFFSSFKENLEHNTIYKMYKYFNKEDLVKYNETIKISETDNYEIILHNKEYIIYVTYFDFNKKIQSFEMSFKITNNRLKVTKPPKKRVETVALPKDSPLAKELYKYMQQYPPDKTGKSTIPKELLDKLVAKYNSKNMPAQNKL